MTSVGEWLWGRCFWVPPPSLASKRMSIDYLVKLHLVQLELLQQRCLGSRNEDSDKRGSMALPPRLAK